MKLCSGPFRSLNTEKSYLSPNHSGQLFFHYLDFQHCNANKIMSNVTKTELDIFKPKCKNLDFESKIKLNGKKLFQTNSVKHCSIKIDKQLN